MLRSSGVHMSYPVARFVILLACVTVLLQAGGGGGSMQAARRLMLLADVREQTDPCCGVCFHCDSNDSDCCNGYILEGSSHFLCSQCFGPDRQVMMLLPLLPSSSSDAGEVGRAAE